MRKSLALQQRLRDAVRADLDGRTRRHQQAVARIKAARAALAATGAPLPPEPLVMLAHGDSWFNYPLTGNGLPYRYTDIIAQLRSLGTTNPVIHNLSHFGDATTEEMSLPKQELMIQALQDPNNWLSSGKPDAILLSGGGDDIAGNQFCIYLDFAPAASGGLNADRFQGVLDMVNASYRDLFAFRDHFALGVPVFAHCYDFPIPNGKAPYCAGPWLKPSLDFCGWNTTEGTAILRRALIDFKNMLTVLAGNPHDPTDPNNADIFTLVDTQGVIDPTNGWANELHPKPNGFVSLARKFVDALRLKFPGRI